MSGTWIATPSTSALTATITGLLPSSGYNIEVAASNAVGQGPESTIVTATTTAPVGTLATAPTAVTLTATGTTALNFSWTAPSTGSLPLSYNTQISPTGTGAWVPGPTVSVTTAQMAGLTASTAYDFRVNAINGAGAGAYSTLLTATTSASVVIPTLVIPGVTTGLAAGVPTGTGVTLTWVAPTTGTAPLTYEIMQALHGGTLVVVGTSSTLTYIVTGLLPTTIYDFAIFAANGAGNGGTSATLTVTTASGVPGAPSGLSPGTSTASSILLIWQAPTSGGAPTGYQVEYKLSTASTYTQFATTTAALFQTITGLAASSTYTFAVAAFNAVGTGAYSSPAISATTLAAPVTVYLGQNTILGTGDGGNGDSLAAQSATLTQQATINSMSFYVTVAGGDLIMGIYDATGSGGSPGNLLATTAQFTPGTGWNTQAIVTPVDLPAGTYWLAYLPASNSLDFVGAVSGTFWAVYPQTFGALPTPFPTAGEYTGTFNWSLYATLTTP